MRLEFNPRAGCYNLYCDTRAEHAKLKQLLERPLTATDLKSMDNMIYADTDSVTAIKTQLNSIYGRTVMMTKEYIVVHYDKRPIIIFKKSIEGVECESDGTATIYSVGGRTLCTDEKYADVIKQLL